MCVSDNKKLLISDLYAKFKNCSEFVRSLKINDKYMNNKLFSYDREYEELFCLFFRDETIKSMAKTVEMISTSKDFAEETFNKLFSNNYQGVYYEILTYSWLLKNRVEFTANVKTNIGDTLSKNDPILDGLFNNCRVFFDIKTFEIPTNMFAEMEKKLLKKFPDYSIMIGGSKDISYKDIENEMISNIDNIINKITTEKQKNENNIFYNDEKLNIEITLKRLGKSGNINSIVSTFDAYKWAEENELFFLKNASQYTTNFPFVLLCPYRKGDLVRQDEQFVYLAFRSISRRAFCKFYNQTNFSNIHNGLAYKKIDNKKYTINDISTYLSAIFFIDISDESINRKDFVFTNPNAKNKLKRHHLEWIFDFENPCLLDDFDSDNY